MKRRRAFTLVELLMIVSILGLLLMILLPSLKSAMEFPRRATCMNNLKQIGVGLYNYHSSNNGYMPPFYSGATAGGYDWIWTDSLAPYVDGDKQPGPGVESGNPACAGVQSVANYPGKSIWACADAMPNPDPDVVTAYGTQYPSGGFRTNYANTCGSVEVGAWQPSLNNAGLILSDGLRQNGSPDSFRVPNRYNQMDSRSVMIFCGCYGCDADAGLPDPATLPNDWNRNADTPPPLAPGKGVIFVPFAHLRQNPGLTVSGNVRAYSKGTHMGGDPNGTDPNSKDTWVPEGN